MYDYSPIYILLKLLGNAPSPPEMVFRQISEEEFQTHTELRASGKDGIQLQDFMSYMMKNMDTPKGLSQPEVIGLGSDIMVAGSDTVTSAVAGTMYYLLSNPSKLQTLTEELRTSFGMEADITITRLSSLKYLNAVITEGERLFPAGPETTRRVVGPAGAKICGDFVPPGTAVGIYQWAAGHNATSWQDAESFVPERWLNPEDGKYKADKRGIHQPFNLGPRNCIGQNLANAELRLVLARLVWNFDFTLCPESNDWLNMTAYGLVYTKRPLMVMVKPVIMG